MPYAIYAAETGRFRGWLDTLPPDLADDGSAATFYETRPTGVWDAAQRLFVAATAPRLISRQTFMDRLGDACVDGMQLASVTFPTDALAVQQSKARLRSLLLRFQVVTEIDLTDPRTIAGVDALITAGLLASTRRAEVLA
jgi:hypothetical protein